MKTAMQIAVESYKNDGVSFTDWFSDNYEMLLEKEKEQIKKAVYDSMGTNFDPNMGRAEMYYNELYTKTNNL